MRPRFQPAACAAIFAVMLLSQNALAQTSSGEAPNASPPTENGAPTPAEVADAAIKVLTAGSGPVDALISGALLVGDAYSGEPQSDVAFHAVADRGQWGASFVGDEEFEVYAEDGAPLIILLPERAAVEIGVTAFDRIYRVHFPDLNIEFRAVPGMFEYAQFETGAAQDYHGVCTRRCDSEDPPIILRVVPQAEFDAWTQAQQQTE